MSVFIASCAQISVQKPLSNEWFHEPVRHDEPYVRATDPDYKPFINPIAGRRMGLIMKRAIATSMSALAEASVTQPDAIITATGLGCIENTEKFLKALCNDGESCLQPTYFINSTHNTIGSSIALHKKCHGYNNTHVHRGVSFESALLDAVLQFELGKIENALVGAHDEMTPDYYNLLDKVDMWKGTFASETAVATVLKNEGDIELVDLDILYKPDTQQLINQINAICRKKGISIEDIDLLVTGKTDNKDVNAIYEAFEKSLALEDKSETYKNLFGESFTSSAYGFYYAFECLKAGKSPQGKNANNVLIYNHYKNIDHSLILMSRC